MNLILENLNVVGQATLDDTDSATFVFIDSPELAWVGGGDLANGY